MKSAYRSLLNTKQEALCRRWFPHTGASNAKSVVAKSLPVWATGQQIQLVKQ